MFKCQDCNQLKHYFMKTKTGKSHLVWFSIFICFGVAFLSLEDFPFGRRFTCAFDVKLQTSWPVSQSSHLLSLYSCFFLSSSLHAPLDNNKKELQDERRVQLISSSVAPILNLTSETGKLFYYSRCIKMIRQDYSLKTGTAVTQWEHPNRSLEGFPP